MEAVFPYLRKSFRLFYPPVEAIKNNKILEVNKIQFILEKEKILKILNKIFYYLKSILIEMRILWRYQRLILKADMTKETILIKIIAKSSSKINEKR